MNCETDVSEDHEIIPYKHSRHLRLHERINRGNVVYARHERLFVLVSL